MPVTHTAAEEGLGGGKPVAECAVCATPVPDDFRFCAKAGARFGAGISEV
jgi:hypothetical protein